MHEVLAVKLHVGHVLPLLDWFQFEIRDATPDLANVSFSSTATKERVKPAGFAAGRRNFNQGSFASSAPTLGAVAAINLISLIDVGCLRGPIAGKLVIRLLFKVQVVKAYRGSSMPCNDM